MLIQLFTQLFKIDQINYIDFILDSTTLNQLLVLSKPGNNLAAFGRYTQMQIVSQFKMIGILWEKGGLVWNLMTTDRVTQNNHIVKTLSWLYDLICWYCLLTSVVKNAWRHNATSKSNLLSDFSATINTYINMYMLCTMENCPWVLCISMILSIAHLI